MTTAADAVLHQCELVALILTYQVGLYGDIQARFKDFNHLVDFALCTENTYCLDPAFRTSLALAREGHLRASDLCLTCNRGRDQRFPLHVAICEGDVSAMRRILACRPDLASYDAIACALKYSHIAIAEELLLKSATVIPELDRNFSDDQRSPSMLSYLAWSLHDVPDTAGLELLWRLYPGNRAEMQDPYLLALYVFPRQVEAGVLNPIVYPTIAVAADEGDLSLVVQLHEADPTEPTALAMIKAAARGHLGIVQYLYFHANHEPMAPYDTDDESTADATAVSMALNEALSHGHLDVARFLLSKDQSSRDTVVPRALVSGHVDVVMALLSDGYPLPSPMPSDLSKIFHDKDAIQLLLFMLEHNVPLDAAYIDQASRYGTMHLMQLLHHKSVGVCTTMALDAAVSGHKWLIADFLLDVRTEGGSVVAAREALLAHQFDFVRRLWHKQPTLRDDALLQDAVRAKDGAAVQFLLAAGVGQPRTVVANNWKHGHEALVSILLPHCMVPGDAVENLVFLTETYHARARYWTKSTLLAVKAEMVRQASAANCLLPSANAGAEIQALAAGLLVHGAETTRVKQHDENAPRRTTPVRVLDKAAVADWSWTALIAHFWVNGNVDARVPQWVQKVKNLTMKMYLQRLLQQPTRKRRFSDLSSAE